jgi:hypothetical protein
MQLHPFFLVAVVASVSVVPLAAHAAPPAKSDVATDKARELHVEGDEFYKKADYARARVSYIAAWALKKNWQLAGSLGDCELKLGMNRDAAEHLAYFLRVSPNQPPAPAAKKLYEDARAKIGTITIAVDTPGADIVVDGKVIGKSPMEDPVFVDPGRHFVEARLGAKRATFEVDSAPAGSTAGVSLVLENARRSMTPAIVVGSVGGAALVGGVILIGLAESKKSDLQTLVQETRHSCPIGDTSPKGSCATLASAASSADTFGNLGIAGLVVGGVAAAGVATYLLWPSSRGDGQTGRVLHVLPTVSTNSGGLLLSGAF